MLTKSNDMVGIRGNQGCGKPWSFCIGALHTEPCLLGDFIISTPLPSPVLVAAAGFGGLYCQKDKLSCQGNGSEREEKKGGVLREACPCTTCPPHPDMPVLTQARAGETLSTGQSTLHGKNGTGAQTKSSLYYSFFLWFFLALVCFLSLFCSLSLEFCFFLFLLLFSPLCLSL